MPFDGNGVYTPPSAPNFPAIAGTTIVASYYNVVINDIATALSNTLTRDNQSGPSTDYNWNNKNLTNVATFGAVAGAFSGLLSANAGIAITGTATLGGVGLAVTVSPAFTGTPTAPTAANGTNTTQIATTAFVLASLPSLVGYATEAYVTAALVPYATSASVTATLASYVTNASLATTLGSYATLASPALTGTPTTNGIEVGFRTIPRSTTSGTIVVGDVGKTVAISAGITIPSATFAAGDAVSLYNDTGGTLTITQGGGLTLRQAATANTGNRSLLQRGFATVWFNGPNEAIITGAGLF